MLKRIVSAFTITNIQKQRNRKKRKLFEQTDFRKEKQPSRQRRPKGVVTKTVQKEPTVLNGKTEVIKRVVQKEKKTLKQPSKARKTVVKLNEPTAPAEGRPSDSVPKPKKQLIAMYCAQFIIGHNLSGEEDYAKNLQLDESVIPEPNVDKALLLKRLFPAIDKQRINMR